MDEWTNADTGVGAAIAAGSQLENGICALFVIAATIIAADCQLNDCDSHMWIMFHCPWFSVHAIDRSSMTSPIRFVRAVIIPAERDFGFW